jgi:hypothetical protein
MRFFKLVVNIFNSAAATNHVDGVGVKLAGGIKRLPSRRKQFGQQRQKTEANVNVTLAG